MTKPKTFSERAREAAELYALEQASYVRGLDTFDKIGLIRAYTDAYLAGARWALESELVREMAEALKLFADYYQRQFEVTPGDVADLAHEKIAYDTLRRYEAAVKREGE